MEHRTMRCKNCEHHYEGKFCNHCGQSAKVERLSVNALVRELPNSIFQLNHGFFYTAKELLIRPGHSIRAFLAGKRKKHYKPIAYLLITTAIYVFVNYLTDKNTFLEDLIVGFNAYETKEDHSTITGVLDWIVKYQTYTFLLIMPFFAVASYLAFRKSKYNYIEHLVLNIYITGQQMLIYLLLGFFFFKDNIFIAVPLLVGMVYNYWVFHQFFYDKKWLVKLGLIALMYIIFIVIFLLVMFSLGIIVNTT